MRVLGIETSSRRGTVALLEDDRVVATLATDAPGGHAPHLLGLVDRALAAAGWPKTSLDRIAVGTGPGSFTGIRVGMALAQGIALGLERPVLGVGSLRAMARAVPSSTSGARCAVVDARRDELFCAEYDAGNVERRPPIALRREAVPAWLAEAGPRVVLGELAPAHASDVFRSELTDLPHAVGVALVAAALPLDGALLEAQYVRPADAIRPNLPRSPLSSGETT
ncbi:MAG TPA: tRNA (adenosine(37)-N6)-threonylcarbamoyltransferase complex dimerization subunit type 1 TsaB [Polyangiaceae bacterium]|nr:tRNA (adenosine(37)-N6)-threonylcarbamoyltransferase complex dimerization subunit type 1 TsaB [Polyangiaceae bacterium]